jgi:REP element-mobilizing transposase RayT
MPDHAHLLVEGLTASSDLRRFVKMPKQRSGGAHSRKYHQPLWQEGYFERVLRDPDDAAQVARYIVMNPVRAGLVMEPCHYPYVGACLFDITMGFAGSKEQDPA